MNFTLPAPMARALPPGHLVFEASFTDDGIALLYLGSSDEVKGARGDTMESPKWAAS